jgi:hypothetical protein
VTFQPTRDQVREQRARSKSEFETGAVSHLLTKNKVRSISYGT